MLNKKNPSPTNHDFEQREVLLNNIDHFIDARNFRCQNMQYIYLIKAPHGKNF